MRDLRSRPLRRAPAFLAAALLALPLLALPAAGQGNGPETPPSATPRTVGPPDVPASDRQVPVAVASDTAPAAARIPDSSSGPKSRADTVLVVQHNFNHRQQIITGSVVMSCLALMLVIMNNYNPR